jgi:glycerol-3-phosphate acyltransferase PlsY
MFPSIVIIVISYLLGSIPSGFIFSKISGKEIFKIGWRKSSGSNVFRYVGVWQGVATGFCDISKGFLAIFLAQNYGLPPLLQALCGVAVVTGNNWSFFIKFAGGRGIGALFGVLLALSPKLVGFSIIPFLLMGLIWNASIGTFFFLASALFFSIYFGRFQTVGISTLLSLVPIFIKRLSPIGEIFPLREKLTLIGNRLVFDNDGTRSGLRIIRLIKKLTWW